MAKGNLETLSAEVSGLLARAPVGGVDEAIFATLAALSRFTASERSHVYVFDSDREIMNEVARWPRPADDRADDEFRSLARTQLPLYAEALFSGRDVVFSDLDEIPASADVDRAFLVRNEVRSAMTVPLLVGEELLGAVTLSQLSSRRSWQSSDKEAVHAVAALLIAALARREAEREQGESIRFAKLITSLVSEFMNLPAEGIDDGVERALETIARFADCDRSAIYILEEDGAWANLYRGWWAPNAKPVVDSYERIETDSESAYGRWIHSEEPYLTLNVGAIVEIRPEAGDRLQTEGLGTVANLPLVIAGRRIGWFGIGARVPRVQWSAAELHSLGLAANALANMYSRRQAEIERRRHRRFEDVLSELASDFIKRPMSQLRLGIEEIIDRFGDFAGSDRAAVLLIDESDETASTYYESVPRGEGAPIRGFPIRAAPRFYEQLMTSRGPWFMYVEEFPPSDQLAAMALDAIGIHTLLNCPLADGERVFGYASIGYAQSHHRPVAGTEQFLAVAAGVIANALSRTRLEREAVEQREALSRALRLGSLGQLATGIAHELNQPLAAISNYSRACARRLDASEIDRVALAEILTRVSEEALRAGEIIHNLRAQVKGGPKKQRTVSVRSIIENAYLLVAGTARDHNVEVKIDCGDDLPPVSVDPTEVGQVVINVVQNAIESIAMAEADVREIEIQARRLQGVVEVVISDSGPGFAPTSRGAIFGQFYTTKPGGLGFGLSISRALIEGNGGTIEAVDSAAGAVIRFTLPEAVPTS